MKQSRTFVLKQVTALTKLGFDEAHIANVLKWTEAHLPDAADEATWVPTGDELAQDLLTDAHVEEAKQAWRRSKNVPRKYKLLLDAT